jgi:integrase
MPKLTQASVEKYKPLKDRREIADTASRPLYLIVEPTGTKSFAMRFRNPYGRPVKLTLGSLDRSGREAGERPIIGAPLTLVAARQLTSEINRQRAMGLDVVAMHRRARFERMAGGLNTFSQACLDYTEQRLKPEVRRWKDAARLLGVVTGEDGRLMIAPRGLADRWRDRRVMEISGDDLHAIIDETREKSAPGLKRRRGTGPSASMARAMAVTLSGLFTWLLGKRRIKSNPMTDVSTPKAGKPLDRTLSDAEIKSFWASCDTLSPPIGQCLKLLLLTGCRLNEIARLSRVEIDDENHSATIPAHRSKNKLAHVVPLPPMAWDILQSVKSTGDFYFTAPGGKPIATWSRIKRELDSKMKPAKPWRLHDLRRTFSTGCNRIGIEPHIVEATINHISGHKAGIARVYNQWHYLPEKTAALNRWANHIAALVEGRTSADVVPMKGKRARR